MENEMEMQSNVVVEEKIELELPSNYKVIFHNDSITPMGFVVQLLSEIFGHDAEKSVTLMFEIHNVGSAVVGTYIKSIAETKQQMSVNAAKKANYPLKVTIEKE